MKHNWKRYNISELEAESAEISQNEVGNKEPNSHKFVQSWILNLKEHIYSID